MRAIGYLTEYGPSRPDGGALTTQNDEFLRFCDASGYQPAAAFLDTADAPDRPGLAQLLDYLDAPRKRLYRRRRLRLRPPRPPAR